MDGGYLTLKVIRPLTTWFIALSQPLLIHMDLQPDNVMVGDPMQQSFRVKLVSFKLCPAWSRAPDVMPQISFNKATDMWEPGLQSDYRLRIRMSPGPWRRWPPVPEGGPDLCRMMQVDQTHSQLSFFFLRGWFESGRHIQRQQIHWFCSVHNHSDTLFLFFFNKMLK